LQPVQFILQPVQAIFYLVQFCSNLSTSSSGHFGVGSALFRPFHFQFSPTSSGWFFVEYFFRFCLCLSFWLPTSLFQLVLLRFGAVLRVFFAFVYVVFSSLVGSCSLFVILISTVTTLWLLTRSLRFSLSFSVQLLLTVMLIMLFYCCPW
jgi:hypothetical protein